MTVTLPDGVLEATKLTEAELVRELALTLFQHERLTLGQAAQLCALPQLDFLATVTVAPITSTVWEVPSEVVSNVDDGMKSRCAANLHHAITVSRERLGKRVASLSHERMQEVCSALRFSLGCG
jgi:mRNA interferase MazF